MPSKITFRFPCRDTEAPSSSKPKRLLLKIDQKWELSPLGAINGSLGNRLNYMLGSWHRTDSLRDKEVKENNA